jgi:hypothetical protein
LSSTSDIVLVSDSAAATPLAANAPRYRFIASPVDSKALYTVALARYDDNSTFLRPAATIQFVMVTDDNDIMPPRAFKEQMAALLQRPVIQHAGRRNLGSEDLDLQGRLDWRIRAAEESRGHSVPLPCEYPLADASNRSFDPEQVSIVYKASGEEEPFPKALTPDRCMDRLGWHYDSNRAAIRD